MTTKMSPLTKSAFKIGAPLVLLFFIGIGFYFRINQMLTISDVLLYQREYDEEYMSRSAQLVLQGYMPLPRLYVCRTASIALSLRRDPLNAPGHVGRSDNFSLARYTTIAFGLITLVAVSILAKRLGGWTSALFSVGLLSIDTIVIEIDRRAMLEPVVNALSVLAIITFLQALNRKRTSIWLFGAGLMGILAALLKTTGIIVLGVIMMYAAWRILTAGRILALDDTRKSRIREFLALMVGAGVGICFVSGYFIITNPIQFLRQVYLFHFFVRRRSLECYGPIQ
jgi:dolichyl-phosphate-mannose--protein O-mannosyl transferase